MVGPPNVALRCPAPPAEASRWRRRAGSLDCLRAFAQYPDRQEQGARPRAAGWFRGSLPKSASPPPSPRAASRAPAGRPFGPQNICIPKQGQRLPESVGKRCGVPIQLPIQQGFPPWGFAGRPRRRRSRMGGAATGKVWSGHPGSGEIPARADGRRPQREDSCDRRVRSGCRTPGSSGPPCCPGRAGRSGSGRP